MTDFVVSNVTPVQYSLIRVISTPFIPLLLGLEFRDPVASTSTVTPNKIAD